MEIRLKNGKTIYLETSWDDGCRHDMRILGMLRKYNLPGMFYIPIFTRELTDDQIRDIASTHDVGAHTLTHRILRLLPEDQERNEIEESKLRLESLVKKTVTSFCYPKGKYNARTIQIVKDADYTEARTVDVGCIDLPQDLFRRQTTVHVFKRREYGGRDWREWAREWFDMVLDPDTAFNYFHLWGHGWEVDQHDQWGSLEQFLYHMANMIESV